MGRMSQNPLSPEIKKEITDSLIEITAKINDSAMLRDFLDDLLTPSEKLMLAKRLMASVLLQRGYSYSMICRALKLSSATVFSIQRELGRRGNGYRTVFNKFFRQPKGQHIIGAIERFLDKITPPVKDSPASVRR